MKKNPIFWDMTLCHFVIRVRFSETRWWSHLQGSKYLGCSHIWLLEIWWYRGSYYTNCGSHAYPDCRSC